MWGERLLGTGIILTSVTLTGSAYLSTRPDYELQSYGQQAQQLLSEAKSGAEDLGHSIREGVHTAAETLSETQENVSSFLEAKAESLSSGRTDESASAEKGTPTAAGAELSVGDGSLASSDASGTSGGNASSDEAGASVAASAISDSTGSDAAGSNTEESNSNATDSSSGAEESNSNTTNSSSGAEESSSADSSSSDALPGRRKLTDPVSGDGAGSSGVEYVGAHTDNEIMLDTCMGKIPYYNQEDSHWKNYKYGGYDDMATYGCGPTAMAMVLSALGTSDDGVQTSPVTVGKWASANGEFSRGNGSYPSIVEDSLTAYGLSYLPVEDTSAEGINHMLQEGHILVALMGPGTFTDDGHFILITDRTTNGRVTIADPKSLANTQKTWDPALLSSQLMQSDKGGGPLWAVSIP